MKFLCSLSLHSWVTTNTSDFRAERYKLFGKDHYDLRIGNILKQKCKECGEGRQIISHFSRNEIVLHMLREVNEGLRRNNESLKHIVEGVEENTKKLREATNRLKSKDPNEKLRKSVERMNKAVRRLKDEKSSQSQDCPPPPPAITITGGTIRG
jgi:hypothetical protein